MQSWLGFMAHPWNLPLNMPGVYSIEHLKTNRLYIGIGRDVKSRLQNHAWGGSPKKLKNAINKYGKAEFLISPLYYSFNNLEDLPILEAIYIAEFDTIRNGFNIIAESMGVGPFGEAFNALLREAQSRPEVIEKRRASVERPEFKAALSKASLAAWAREGEKERRGTAIRKGLLLPDVNEALRAAQRIGQADPDAKARKRAAMQLSNNRPEVKAKNSAAISNLSWITDGSNNARIPRAGSIPDGWKLGRTGHGLLGPKPGNIWVTDGKASKHIKADDPIPVGWRLGRASYKHYKNR